LAVLCPCRIKTSSETTLMIEPYPRQMPVR